MTRGVSETWVEKTTAAMREKGGRFDWSEITIAAGLEMRGGNRTVPMRLIREMIRRKIIKPDGYKGHTYPGGRTVSREAYVLVAP